MKTSKKTSIKIKKEKDCFRPNNCDLNYEDYTKYIKILFHSAERIVDEIKRGYSKPSSQFKNAQKDVLKAVMFVIKRELDKK